MAHTTNPWIAAHIDAEVNDFGGRADVVIGEYAEAGGPVPCRCGGQAFYKATIGVHKCTRCGDLYYEDGEPLD